MIKIKEAKKSFKDAIIFEHLNLEINEPGLYIIQGESGSGKSTLLNILAGFDSFDRGDMEINENRSTIFQNYELIDEINVQKNILLTKQEFNDEELQLLEKLGIKELLNYYPNECSGGQKQRVGIARSLLLNPNIILCDEPTESLDIANKRIVMQLLKDLSKSKIIIVATHDQKMIDEYADCCFKIQDKKLIQANEYHSNDAIIERQLQIATPRAIRRFIHKILDKKTILASLFLVFLLILVQGLFIFEKKMFYVPETLNAVNVNRLYVETGINNYDFKQIDLLKENLTPIIKFRNMEVDGQLFNCHIYPYVENELELQGEKPKGNTIVINQNVAKKLNGAIGKEVTINYFVSSLIETMTFSIGGIINESDSNEQSVYYDIDYVNQELNNRILMGGKTQMEYILEHGTYFETPKQYSELSHYYKKASDTKQVMLSNTLYDERCEFKETMVVYQWLFTLFEALIFVGILILMTIYVIRDTNHYLSICSILISMQLPLKRIRRNYIWIKIKYFVPLVLLSGLGFYGSYEYLNMKQFMKTEDVYVILTSLGFIIVLYLGLLYFSIRKLKQSQISMILKNSKD